MRKLKNILADFVYNHIKILLQHYHTLPVKLSNFIWYR